MSGSDAFEMARLFCAAFAGCWLAMKVELKWIRSDVAKLEKKTEDHSVRIRVLEIGE